LPRTILYEYIRVEISLVFEIFSNFLFGWGGGSAYLMYANIAYNTRNKNIYGLSVGISIVLHILPVTLGIYVSENLMSVSEEMLK
jgi:hypothetical protein